MSLTVEALALEWLEKARSVEVKASAEDQREVNWGSVSATVTALRFCAAEVRRLATPQPPKAAHTYGLIEVQACTTEKPPKDAGAVPLPNPLMASYVHPLLGDMWDRLDLQRHAIAYGDAREAAGRADAMPPEYELIHRLDRMNLHRRAETAMSCNDGALWYWQGDGQDFPESIVCPIIMHAETLRELLAKIPEQHPPAEPAACMQDAATTCWQHRPGSPCPTPDSCRSNGCSAVERELFPDAANPSPAHAGAGDVEELADFTEWLAREMPPGSVISDPRWWAPRIARRLTGGNGHA